MTNYIDNIKNVSVRTYQKTSDSISRGYGEIMGSSFYLLGTVFLLAVAVHSRYEAGKYGFKSYLNGLNPMQYGNYSWGTYFKHLIRQLIAFIVIFLMLFGIITVIAGQFRSERKGKYKNLNHRQNNQTQDPDNNNNDNPLIDNQQKKNTIQG